MKCLVASPYMMMSFDKLQVIISAILLQFLRAKYISFPNHICNIPRQRMGFFFGTCSAIFYLTKTGIFDTLALSSAHS